MQKSRITNLSTRYLSFYKLCTWTLFISLIVLCIFQAVLNSKYYLVSCIFLLYQYVRRNSKTFHVEFDDEFLYLIQKDADILIPLQNIKGVELKTLGGLYEIKLYHPELVGELIYYKPSLLYPFNFKSKDAMADILRNKIEKAKRKSEPLPTNALMS